MMKLLKIILVINFPAHLFFAVSYFFWPEKMGEYFDIHLGSPTAIADFRATYSGLPIAFCFFIFLGILQEKWTLSAFMLVLITTAGLGIGRLYSVIVLWGNPIGFKPIIFIFLFGELLITFFELWILNKVLSHKHLLKVSEKQSVKT